MTQKQIAHRMNSQLPHIHLPKSIADAALKNNFWTAFDNSTDNLMSNMVSIVIGNRRYKIKSKVLLWLSITLSVISIVNIILHFYDTP